MPCFTNLPLSWAAADDTWLTYFIAAGMSPELGMDAGGLARPHSWHKENAQRLRDAGIACAVHLPFIDLDVGSPELSARRKAWDTVRKAAAAAALYGAAHMIGHPGFVPARDDDPEQPQSPSETWLERVLPLWSDLPDIAGAPLFLENTYDLSPNVLTALMQRLAQEPAAGTEEKKRTGGIGICFDAGHHHCFAGGAKKQDMPRWIGAFSPWLRHLHLHDNHGELDLHLGLGQGGVPFLPLLQELRKRNLSPTVTFEPHDAEALFATAAWLRARPEAALQLGWTPPRATAMPLPRFFYVDPR